MGLCCCLGWGFLAVVAYYVFLKFVYPKICPQSFFFMGKPRSFNAKINQEVGFDLTSFIPRFGEFLMLRNRELADQIVGEDRTLIIGHAMRQHCAARAGMTVEARQFGATCLRVLTTYPKKNQAYGSLMLSGPDVEMKAPEFEFHQIHEDCWHIQGSSQIKGGRVDLASLLVRLRGGGKEGELVLLNPIGPSPDHIVEAVNKIGTVKHLVNPAKGHGIGITWAAKVWPEARIYGSDSGKKHGHKELNWDAFSDKVTVDKDGMSNEWFGEELPFIRCDGHYFLEPVFYHKPSSTLFLVDLALKAQLPSGSIYAATMGMMRGVETTEVGPQSYHLAMTWKSALFRQRIEKVFEWRPEQFVLGHGGYYGGRGDVEAQMRNGLGWALDPSTTSSSELVQRFVNFPAYLLAMKVDELTFRIMVKKLFGKKEAKDAKEGAKKKFT